MEINNTHQNGHFFTIIVKIYLQDALYAVHLEASAVDGEAVLALRQTAVRLAHLYMCVFVYV